MTYEYYVKITFKTYQYVYFSCARLPYLIDLVEYIYQNYPIILGYIKIVCNKTGRVVYE